MTPLPEARELLHKLFGYLDERRYDDLLELFTPGGEWLRQGHWYKGRQEIMSALSKRSTTQRICHVITNSYLERHDVTSALMVSYMTTYTSDNSPAGAAVPVLHGPSSLFRTRTELQTFDNRWCIAKQSGILLFKFEGPARVV